MGAGIHTSMAPPAGRAVPTRIDELDAEWLTAALQHAGVLPSGRVADVTHERVGVGRGFAGTLARLHLRYEQTPPGAPASLIAKLASDHDPTREMMTGLDAYAKEIRFYRELAPSSGIATPTCYFAHHDRDGGRFLLLLEDMAPAAAPDLAQGMSLGQVHEVLDQIARFHAHWWNAVDGLDWVGPSESMIEEVRQRFLSAVDRVVAQVEGERPTFARLARSMKEVMLGDEFRSRLERGPLTLTHGDLHPENLFFPTEAGGRFAIADWQTLIRSRHGTADVIRILVLGMTPEARRQHQKALLRRYRATLRAHGVRGFSALSLWLRLREEVAAFTIVGVLAFDTLDFEVDGGERMAELLGARIDTALDDFGVERMLTLSLVLLRVSRWLRRLTGSSPKRLP